MKTIRIITLMLLLTAAGASQASGYHKQCGNWMVAGKWVFATNIGRQMLGAPFPPDKDITAIGTMNIRWNGALSGKFDATVQDAFFLPDNTYTGSVVVRADCTGTLTFETGQGTIRTDSIVVISRDEMLGMSQDPLNLWTYQARRIKNYRPGRPD